MEHLSLRHDEVFLTFEFSNLNYTSSFHTVSRYWQENSDRECAEINARRTSLATYTLFRTGNYIFRITAADNNMDWSTTETRIALLPA